jgi:hypothetical protein
MLEIFKYEQSTVYIFGEQHDNSEGCMASRYMYMDTVSILDFVKNFVNNAPFFVDFFLEIGTHDKEAVYSGKVMSSLFGEVISSYKECIYEQLCPQPNIQMHPADERFNTNVSRLGGLLFSRLPAKLSTIISTVDPDKLTSDGVAIAKEIPGDIENIYRFYTETDISHEGPVHISKEWVGQSIRSILTGGILETQYKTLHRNKIEKIVNVFGNFCAVTSDSISPALAILRNIHIMATDNLKKYPTSYHAFKYLMQELAVPINILYSVIMDAYLIGRYFKGFDISDNASRPEFPYHSLLYTGYAHSEFYIELFEAMGYKRVFKAYTTDGDVEQEGIPSLEELILEKFSCLDTELASYADMFGFTK